MTDDEKDAIAEAVLHLAQISAALACVRSAMMGTDREASDTLAMIGTFAEWASTKLDAVQV